MVSGIIELLLCNIVNVIDHELNGFVVFSFDFFPILMYNKRVLRQKPNLSTIVSKQERSERPG
jgi:hypothetical protein